MERDICSWWSRTRGTRQTNWRPLWTPSSSVTATSLTPKTCCCPWWPTIDHTFVNSPFSEFWSHESSRKGRVFDSSQCHQLTLTAKTMPQWSTGRWCAWQSHPSQWVSAMMTSKSSCGNQLRPSSHSTDTHATQAVERCIKVVGDWGITVCVWQFKTRRDGFIRTRLESSAKMPVFEIKRDFNMWESYRLIWICVFLLRLYIC